MTDTLRWTGECFAAFQIFQLREGTAGTLQGHFGVTLDFDLRRTVSVERTYAPDFGAWRIAVEVTGDELSPSFRQLLINSEFPGALLARFETAVLRVANEAIAAQIRWSLAGDVTWTGEPVTVPLHFPYFHRNLSKRWLLGEDDWQVSVDEGGRILAHEREIYQTALLVAMAVHSAEGHAETAEVTFQSKDPMTAREAKMRLPPLLDLYGLPTEWITSELLPPLTNLEARWELSLAGSAGAAWIGMSKERTVEFFTQMSDASMGLQRTMRKWIPYLQLTNMERLKSPDTAGPLLVYGAMRPYRSMKQKQYVRDVIDVQGIARGLKWVARGVSRNVQRTQQYLRAEGNRELADRFIAKRASRLIREMQLMPRHFRSLIACESYLLDEMLRLAAAGREMAAALRANPPKPVKAVWRTARELHETLEIRLRRAWGRGGFPELSPLVLLEMTRGLAEARTVRVPMDVRLRVRDLDTGTEYCWFRRLLPELPVESDQPDEPQPGDEELDTEEVIAEEGANLGGEDALE